MSCVHTMKGLPVDTLTCIPLGGTAEFWEKGTVEVLFEQARMRIMGWHEGARGHPIVEQQACMHIMSWVQFMQDLPGTIQYACSQQGLLRFGRRNQLKV